jgi:hypothetical protein
MKTRLQLSLSPLIAAIGVLFLLMYGPAGLCAEADLSLTSGKYKATWESLDRHPVAPWWLDAKFGVYVHWSFASVPSWGNHSSFYWPNLLKSQRLEADGPRPPKIDIAEEYVGLWQFHRKTYGPEFKYEDFAPLFRAEVFNADRWADLFARSGARYVVLTTKHHDGFCLWPSAEASRNWGRPWNAHGSGHVAGLWAGRAQVGEDYYFQPAGEDARREQAGQAGNPCPGFSGYRQA